MSDEERALTDAAPAQREANDEAVALTETASDPESFDVGAMVAGVRATRTRVKIQPNAHLLERLQEIADEIDSYPTDEDVPDSLVEEWVETKAEFDHVDVYVIEGRTSDWVRQFHKDLKGKGINPDRKGLSDQERTAQNKRQVHAQIAAQIISPEGVTEEQVADIYASNEPQGDLLFQAVGRVNTRPVKEMTPDFSQRVSRLSRRG